MQDKHRQFTETIRQLVANAELESALDTLYEFLCKVDDGLADDCLKLQQRLARMERDNAAGIISRVDYQLELNRISASVLYLVKQIPEQAAPSKKSAKKKGTGKLLHDIPPKMPVGLETKCTVRIAESEDILLIGYKRTEHTELEDIAITKVMEVELIDFGEEKNFSIRTFSSGEQRIEEGDFTQWLFFVKPLHAGVHTLYLKVSTIQEINDKERKKEIVLERKVNVVTEPGEAMEEADDREWHDTRIALSTSPLKSDDWLPWKKKGGYGYVGTETDPSELFTHTPKEQVRWDDLKGDVFKHRSEEKGDMDPFAERFKDLDWGDDSGKVIKIPGKWDDTFDRPPKSPKPRKQKKKEYLITDELVPKEAVTPGEMIRIKIVTTGFVIDKLEFYVDDVAGIVPLEQKGGRFLFTRLSLQKTFKFTIRDTHSGKSLERELAGDRNYEWKVKRVKK